MPVSCPLCDRLPGGDCVEQNRHGCAFPDAFPVAPGHVLVIPRRHEPDLFALTPEEQSDLWALVRVVGHRLADELRTRDFTVGANVGVAAGQTILHAHIHVIPRFPGDVPDPRGGIRWVIPSRAAYW